MASEAGGQPRREALALLERNADKYFGAAGGELRLDIVREYHREASYLCLVDVGRGDSRLHLAVKKQLMPAWDTGDVSPPLPHRAAVTPRFRDRTRCEGETLRRIEALVCEARDPCLGAIHVYDLLPDEGFLVMERSTGVDLATLTLRYSRRWASARTAPLLTACRSAGVWLRRYHDLMPLEGMSPVVSEGVEFREIADRRISTLERWLPDGPFWAGLRASIQNGLRRFPDAIALRGASHGDYWGGNILCEPDGRVSVIDTFGAGRGPVYLDLAYFLVHLRAAPLQIYSQGLWCSEDALRESRSSFLAGYGLDEGADRGALALFEILVLLYKWSASYAALDGKRSVARSLKRATLAWRSRYLRRLIEACQSELEES